MRIAPAGHRPGSLLTLTVILPGDGPTNQETRCPHPPASSKPLSASGGKLPKELSAYQNELDATPLWHKERRERITWQMRRVPKQLAEVEARLAGDEIRPR